MEPMLGVKKMKKTIETVRAFRREEDGVALTEYLVLLALLIGGVIGAVTLAGEDLSEAWGTWGDWWSTNVNAPS